MTPDKPSVLNGPPPAFQHQVQTLIIGAGACGMVAALAAHEAGQEVLLIEADAVPSGSTALSAGLIPAAGTRVQAAAGIDDSAKRFAADIQAKAAGQNDDALVTALANGAGPAIDWLTERFDLPFSVVTDFDYPGHSRRRMHGLPSRSGQELIDRLRTTVEAQGLDIICDRRAADLFFHDGTVRGVRVIGPTSPETIGCDRLILACNGFGGNRGMVQAHMPEIADALWFGHDGNRGEAVIWGDALGAASHHLGAYQGHGNVAHPHGILITWAVVTEGGVQVNLNGQRFWNETLGYSEAARHVLAQPGGVAWAIFDDRIAGVARQFADFKSAEAQGAVRKADTIADLAAVCDLPVPALTEALTERPTASPDQFGRVFPTAGLSAPYCAVKVTGALFHTQGGLQTDGTGRVRKTDGSYFDNLFAAGGAACGVSGAGDSGYLSGNGLLSAVVLGRAAGMAQAPST